MWRFEQKGLFAREKVPKWGICKPGARRAGREEGGPAARVRARNPNSLAFMGGERELEKPDGRVQKSPAAKVRARKPNSLAFTGDEREPEKPNGWIQEGPAAKVRAQKPNSLAFMGGEREPEKSPGQIPGCPTATVRAQKPNSLAFRGGEREPDKPAGRTDSGPAGLSAGPSKNKNFESADRSVRQFKVFFITYYILFIRKKLTVSLPKRSGGWSDPLRPRHCFPLRSPPPPSHRPRRCQRPHPCRHSESWEYHFPHRRSS